MRRRASVRARGEPRAVTLAAERVNDERVDPADTEELRLRLRARRRGLVVLDLDVAMLDRPRTRGDCEAGPRPCPWVSCKYHLYLDVNPQTGGVKLNFPHREVGELVQTCALDVADEGDHALEHVGELLNLVRERVRQIEVWALLKLRRRHED